MDTLNRLYYNYVTEGFDWLKAEKEATLKGG